jgi:hypothetical protein
MKISGSSEKEIIAAAGCPRQAVYPLRSKYTPSRKKDIEKTVKIKRGGIRFGERRTLSAAREKNMQNKIREKYPDELKFDFAVWTRGAAKELIKREYGTGMPMRTAGSI